MRLQVNSERLFACGFGLILIVAGVLVSIRSTTIGVALLTIGGVSFILGLVLERMAGPFGFRGAGLSIHGILRETANVKLKRDVNGGKRSDPAVVQITPISGMHDDDTNAKIVPNYLRGLSDPDELVLAIEGDALEVVGRISRELGVGRRDVVGLGLALLETVSGRTIEITDPRSGRAQVVQIVSDNR